jgi:hypothetical protein
MTDCLKCNKCIRQEVYDGQWGRFIFTNKYSVNVRIIINGRLNPWNKVCHEFECGEPKINFMSNEEKQKY